MCFMHELKQLVDHSLQEFPVGTQELRILSNDIPAKQQGGGQRGVETAGWTTDTRGIKLYKIVAIPLLAW